MKEIALIDNDFMLHLANIRGRNDLEDLIQRFFKALGIEARIHELVYKNETKIVETSIVRGLFQHNIITEETINDICDSSEKRNYYSMLVRQIYQDFMGRKLPCNNVLEEWKLNASLGEVHTVALCVLRGWNCFLSDDNKASKNLGAIVKSRTSATINVQNREDCCMQIKKLPSDNKILNRNELRILSYKRVK